MTALSPRRLAALALLLVVPACADATGPTDGLDAEAAVALAGTLTGQALLPAAGAPASAPGATASADATFEISRTSDCPGGGSVSATIAGTREHDGDARESTLSWLATMRHDGCVFDARGRQVTIVSSDLEGSGAARWRWPDGQGGFALRGFALERMGQIEWAVGDRSGSCSVALVTTWDADAGRFLTNGTVCDHTISSDAVPSSSQG